MGRQGAATRSEGTERAEAFARVVEELHDALSKMAVAITADRAVAEDAVAGAYASTWSRFRKADVDALDRYLWRAVARQARRLAARRRRPVPFVTPPDAADPADVVAGELALAQALGSLPVAQRAVVALRYVAGFSESDVAAFLSIPAGTVKSRLSRAAASLRGLADAGPARSSEPPGGHSHA